MVGTYHHIYPTIENVALGLPRVKTNVNHGLGMIMMCPCRLISCNRCTTLVLDLDGAEDCACEGEGGEGKDLCIFCIFHSFLL